MDQRHDGENVSSTIMETPDKLSPGGAERKLIWCSEVCRKATSSESRDQLANIAADVGAEFKWFKKAATFSRWFAEKNPRTLYLLTDWREAKPCTEEIDKASKELPDMGSITMMVLCTEKKAATRAQSWANLSTVRPRIVRNFSDVKCTLRVISSKKSSETSDVPCRRSYKVPRAPVPPPLEPLSWVKLKLVPPLTSHHSNQEPQSYASALPPPALPEPTLPAPNYTLSLPTEPWRVPRLVQPTNLAGPKEVGLTPPVVLPQPVRLLGRLQAPSSPPWPGLLINDHKGKLTAATLGAMAEADTEAETEPEAEESSFSSVTTLVSNPFEADVPALEAAAEAEAEAGTAGLEADSTKMIGAAETPVQDWTRKALTWMQRDDDTVPLCF